LKARRIVFRSITFVLAVIIIYSAYQLWDINRGYAQAEQLHRRLLEHMPTPQTSASSASSDSYAALAVNQSIIDLQEKYPDAIGWLTIPNTLINYPFVQGNDNDYYLHLDLDKNQSKAGTIFMDYRNSEDLSDFNNIIFGHNMRNGSMFGTLQNFNDQDFFDNNRTGTIFLANKTYEIVFMAYAVIKPNDIVIYSTMQTADADKLSFFEYVKSIARYYRDIEVTEGSRIVTLSTCSYEFNNARMVLIGKITDREIH